MSTTEVCIERATLSLNLLIFLLIFSTGTAAAQNAPARKPKLVFVVILTRHGVRSPITNLEELNAFSSEPWPVWGVPSGDLTPQGRKLMELLGSYYRDYFSSNGLLPPTGCEDADRIHIRADVNARTRETGRALASGMMPGCNVDVHVASGKDDPLFNPLLAGIGEPDRALAVASIVGRIGENPTALTATYRYAFETLREVLFGCAPFSPCPAEKRSGKQALLDQASTVVALTGGHLADVQGPLKIGSNLSEALLLEYANGMEGEELGWGRLTRVKLLEIMRIHEAYADLARRTPYVARIQASNLLSHILRSMAQAVSGTTLSGSIGKSGDHVLVISGHDTNLSNIAGILGISWLLSDYQPEETPPGGALVFELWQQKAGEFEVNTYFTAQSLEQMRNVLPLSLDNPPLKSPVFVPGCSRGDRNMTCTWEDFQHTINNALDPSFVTP
jgi:4-phytase / acid phosphatase